MSPPAAEHSGMLHGAISLCIRYLDPVDIVCCSSSSKGLAQLCKAELLEGNKQLAYRLLQQSVSNVATATAELRAIPVRPVRESGGQSLPSRDPSRIVLCLQKQHRSQQGVSWLLQAAAGSLFEPPTQHSRQTISVLTGLSHVPLPLAKELVQAGMRVSYEQVVAAAKQLTAEAEVWLRVQQQQGVETDVPVYAINLIFSAGQPESCVSVGKRHRHAVLLDV